MEQEMEDRGQLLNVSLIVNVFITSTYQLGELRLEGLVPAWELAMSLGLEQQLVAVLEEVQLVGQLASVVVVEHESLALHALHQHPHLLIQG